jgi:hypothetical protein
MVTLIEFNKQFATAPIDCVRKKVFAGVIVADMVDVIDTFWPVAEYGKFVLPSIATTETAKGTPTTWVTGVPLIPVPEVYVSPGGTIKNCGTAAKIENEAAIRQNEISNIL